MLTFFLAGHETTAGTLTWAMLELTRHPTVMQQLVREVDEVYAASGIGSGGKTELDVDDMGKFKYMTQVLKVYGCRRHRILKVFPAGDAPFVCSRGCCQPCSSAWHRPCRLQDLP
jgi:hypothetical protein